MSNKQTAGNAVQKTGRKSKLKTKQGVVNKALASILAIMLAATMIPAAVFATEATGGGRLKVH